MLLKMVRISWFNWSWVQASSSPESERLGVQSPGVEYSRDQEPRLQASSRSEFKGPVGQSPRVPESRVQEFRVQASRPYA